MSMNETSDSDSPILWIFKFLTYFTGIYFHIKVILVSIREKGLTWKLDITNSSISIAHFTHILFLYIITYAVDDLSLYTGDWFCYLAKEVRFYGALHLTGHSLVLSVMKYILIVNWEKISGTRNNMVKEICFWFDLLHPIISIGVFIIITPDFIWAWDGYKEIDLCLGDPKNHWVPNSNTSQTKGHDLCLKLLDTVPDSYLEYIIWVIRSSVCWIQIAVLYLVSWNFWEMITYCRIFAFMHRQLQNHPNKRRKSNGEETQLDEADKAQLRNNLKRWEVNAQITAATTIVEFLGNLTYVIHLKIAKGSNLASATHFELIYAILIPYSLLKNTSDNKNRIIEAGWKNIFKNILGIKDNSAVEPSPDNESSVSKKSSEVKNDSTTNQRSPDINETVSSSNVQRNTETKKVEILGGTRSKIAASKGPNNKKIMLNSWFESSSLINIRNTKQVQSQCKAKDMTDEEANEKNMNANDIEILSVTELSNN